MAHLALVRHGESEWNAKNLWTGWTDIPLSQKGIAEAKDAAEKLKNVNWDMVFQSDLIRAKQTTDEILKSLNSPTTPIVTSPALRERNYGIYTGKNKLGVEKELGEEEYKKLRRGWDYPIQNGESLKQVYERVVPFFVSEIAPKLQDGKNVIISSSGNTLRALVKYLKNISDEEIANFELATGEVLLIDYTSQSVHPDSSPRT